MAQMHLGSKHEALSSNPVPPQIFFPLSNPYEFPIFLLNFEFMIQSWIIFYTLSLDNHPSIKLLSLLLLT
jgi:hypothetical protein